MEPAEVIGTLEAALDASVEECRHMAAELGRQDLVVQAARRLVETWRGNRLAEEHLAALERELKHLAN